MISAADIFQKFKGSGMLHSVAWTPAAGGAGNTFEARLMNGSGINLPLISAAEIGIQFMSADAPGVMQGDSIVLDEADEYVLRERDQANCAADGTLIAYTLRKVAA